MVAVGELFAGYGGLSMALADVLGADLAWYADNDPAASAVMRRAFPGIPNLGDVTAVDWPDVPPVDVLAGGFPCQDVSHAGALGGLHHLTRSGLWGHMAYAVAALRPALVVIENVRGLTNAPADSDVEPCPWCMGDRPTSPLRALGAVLADLADLGYDAWWSGLRASDVGAAHDRLRVFVLAWQRNPNAHSAGRREHRRTRAVGPQLDPAQRVGAPLLPTPAVNDMGANKTVEWWDEWAPTLRRAGGGLAGRHGDSLSIEVRRLPTPRARSMHGAGHHGEGSPNLQTVVAEQTWGPYRAAIDHHAAVLGRDAPPPTEEGPEGPRLSPRFVEWLMMLPDGHVTDPGLALSRNAQLRVLGNGVVPLQASTALRWFLSDVAP